jgi:hypothetical protein
MPGLVPGIHDFTLWQQDVDGRDEPGHDEITDSHPLTDSSGSRSSYSFSH